MELKRTPIESIQPNPNNPRRDFGNIKALAETFKLNPTYPGEPYTPLIVVADGDMFTISDGERRYKAMVELGTKECSVYVCEDFEQADSLAAMLATDDKKALTDVERSIGVQQMLLLGVAPKMVETAAGLKRGQAAKVKSAMESFGCEVAQATIDQVLKAEEIKQIGGDDKDVEKVLGAAPDEWEGTYKGLKSRIERERALDDFNSTLAERGLALKAGHSDDTRYERMFKDADELAVFLDSDGLPEGGELVYVENSATIDLYVPVSEEAVDDGDGETRKAVHMAIDATEAGVESRASWYVASCKHGTNKAKRLRTSMHVDKLLERRASSDISAFIQEAGARPDELAQGGGLTGLAGAFILRNTRGYRLGAYWVALLVEKRKSLDASDMERVSAWLDTLEAFMSDGWRIEDAEREVYVLACEALGRRPYDDGGAIGNGEPEAKPSPEDAASMPAYSVAIDIDDVGPEAPDADASEMPDDDVLEVADLVIS